MFPVFPNEAIQDGYSFTVNKQLTYAPLHKRVNERTSSEAGMVPVAPS